MCFITLTHMQQNYVFHHHDTHATQLCVSSPWHTCNIIMCFITLTHMQQNYVFHHPDTHATSKYNYKMKPEDLRIRNSRHLCLSSNYTAFSAFMLEHDSTESCVTVASPRSTGVKLIFLQPSYILTWRKYSYNNWTVITAAHSWPSQHIRCHCGNMSVLSINCSRLDNQVGVVQYRLTS